MFICVCRGISEKDLQNACKGPSKNPKDILKTLGVGQDCGTCLQFAIEKYLENQANVPTAAKSPLKK